jgi:SagB-type dehydrogenase family enzyme
VVAPFAVELLDFFRSPRSIAEALAHFTRAEPSSLRRAIAGLQAHRLIVPAGKSGTRPAHALDAWSPIAPIAGFYHFATKDPEIPHGKALQAIEDAAIATPPATPAARSRRRQVTLGRKAGEWAAGSLPATLLERRSWRVFGQAPVRKVDFEQLLQLTFGVQVQMRTHGGRPAKLKTSPSAGAQHPIDCYIAAVNVKGIAPGLYRYDDETHALEVIRRGLSRPRLERYLGRQWWFRDAGFAVFFVAHVPAVLTRYAHPRAYRLLLLDAGHLCQTFCLTATWLGLAPFCTAALADSLIERDLGLDGVNDIVLYAAGAGTRPRGGYRQWPEEDAAKAYLRPARRG